MSFTGLIGPNGSGKTTLFNLIAASLKPDSGKVLLEDKDMAGFAPHDVFSHGVYRTFQTPQIVPSLSVLENMLLADRKRIGEGLFSSIFSRRKWKAEDNGLVEKAFKHLKFLKIEQYANSPPTILSGGQLKLLEIGRALMSEASILLLDEPAAGVNPTLASSIFDLLEQLRRDHGVTIFVIEHKVELVFERVDYVFVMNKGKLLFSGSPDEVAKEESVIEAYLGE